MKFNFTKFTLPALLIAASASAFAEDEPAVVKLNNEGGTVTWSNFVGVMNNEIEVVGDTTKLPQKDRYALGNAINAVTTAQTNLDNVDKDGKLQKAIDDADAEVKKVEGEQTEAAKAVTAAEGEYNSAQQSLTQKQEDLADKETEQKRLNSLISGLNTKKQTYTENITNLTAELTPLVANTVTKEIKTVKPWLKSAIDNEAAFAGNYSVYYKNAKTYKSYTAKQLADAKLYPNSYIYCNIIFEEDREEYYLELSFTDLPSGVSCVDLFNADSNTTYPQNLSNDTWYKLSVALLDYYILEPKYYTNHTEPTVYTMESVDVYLSPEYPNGGGYFNVPWAYTNKLTALFSSITSPLDALGSKEDYITVTYEQYNKDQARIDEINEEISDWKAKINTANAELAGYDKQLNGVHGDAVTEDNPETDGIVDEINSLNNDINVLKKTTIPNAKTAWDDAIKAQEPYDKAVSSAKEALTEATQALTDAQTTAQTNLDNAEAALVTARATAQAAANTQARNNYNRVTLTGNVVATASIEEFTGTIIGGNFIITAPENEALFETFGGSLSNVAINGTTFHDNNGGRFTNVVRWDNTATGNNKGAYYGENANDKATFSDLFALGYAAREIYGVELGKGLTNLTDASMVYQITVMNKDGVQPQYFVQVDTKGQFIISSGSAYTLPVNTFAKSTDDDIAGRGTTNVYYGENNDCDKAVIEDKKDFYCPVNITAKNLTYNRSFMNSATIDGTDYYGFNAVCLPFALNTSIAGENEAIRSISVFDRVNEEAKSFHFTQTGVTAIPAYTPILVLVNKGKSIGQSLSLSNVNIEETDKQIIVYEGAKDDESVAYGTVKNTNRGDLNGASKSPYIYGLNPNNGKFQAASATANVSAFRMMIGTQADVMNPKSTKKRVADYIDEYSISIFDENGRDILAFDTPSGIDNIVADTADAITVAGGQGEIIITAKADYGKVEIYNLNGVLIDYVDVVEGTTTVGVSKGYYIVMGQKVMVK